MSRGNTRSSRRVSQGTVWTIIAVAVVAAIALSLTVVAFISSRPPVNPGSQAQALDVTSFPTSTPEVPKQVQPKDVLPRLDDAARPFTIVIFGDSTGVSRNGWPVHLAEWLGKTYDRTTIVHPWDGTPNSDQYQQANWTIHTGSGAQVDIYNASVSSTAAEYPMTRLDKMVPVDGKTIDMVFVNYGHNQTNTNMVPQASALVDASTARYPDAAVVSFLQNSERKDSPHASMLKESNYYWNRWLESHGYASVDIQSVFDQAPNLDAILSDDGDIHPNDAGYALWADTLTKYLDGQR